MPRNLPTLLCQWGLGLLGLGGCRVFGFQYLGFWACIRLLRFVFCRRAFLCVLGIVRVWAFCGLRFLFFFFGSGLLGFLAFRVLRVLRILVVSYRTLKISGF